MRTREHLRVREHQLGKLEPHVRRHRAPRPASSWSVPRRCSPGYLDDTRDSPAWNEPWKLAANNGLNIPYVAISNDTNTIVDLSNIASRVADARTGKLRVNGPTLTDGNEVVRVLVSPDAAHHGHHQLRRRRRPHRHDHRQAPPDPHEQQPRCRRRPRTARQPRSRVQPGRQLPRRLANPTRPRALGPAHRPIDRRPRRPHRCASAVPHDISSVPAVYIKWINGDATRDMVVSFGADDDSVTVTDAQTADLPARPPAPCTPRPGHSDPPTGPAPRAPSSAATSPRPNGTPTSERPCPTTTPARRSSPIRIVPDDRRSDNARISSDIPRIAPRSSARFLRVSDGARLPGHAFTATRCARRDRAKSQC